MTENKRTSNTWFCVYHETQNSIEEECPYCHNNERKSKKLLNEITNAH